MERFKDVSEEVEFYVNETAVAFDYLGVDENYTKKGIEANVKKWMSNKKGVINLLRKHPLWNEESKAIIIPKTLTRPSGSPTEIYCAFYQIISSFDMEALDLDSWRTFSFLANIFKHIYSQHISEENALAINDVLPVMKAREGMRTARVAQKFFKKFNITELQDYNKNFAAYSDLINPISITTTTVLSVNFIDFMLMSNGNSWSSCHGLVHRNGYDGCYKAGCASYANDKISLIFYTVDSDLMEKYDNKIWMIPKITREIFFYENPVLVQERLYPQCHDGESGTGDDSIIAQYRNIVEKIIADCEELPNLWKKSENTKILKHEQAYMYDDWNAFDNWIYCFSDKATDEKRLVVGNTSYCMSCGEERNDDETGSILCDCCDPERCEIYMCENCGCTSSYENDFNYCEDVNGYLCDDCSFYCEFHQRRESTANYHGYLDDFGDVCIDTIEEGIDEEEIVEVLAKYDERRYQLSNSCNITKYFDEYDSEKYVLTKDIPYFIKNEFIAKCSECGEYFVISLVDENMMCTNCKNTSSELSEEE